MKQINERQIIIKKNVTFGRTRRILRNNKKKIEKIKKKENNSSQDMCALFCYVVSYIIDDAVVDVVVGSSKKVDFFCWLLFSAFIIFLLSFF